MTDFARYLGGTVMLLTALLGGPGCRREPAGSTDPPAEAPQVLLRGDFRGVAKPTQGTAEIVRRGANFELHLRGVTLDTGRPVRVYLVGAEQATTTRRVVETEQKYDMAQLEVGADEQVVALPSEPDRALRTVVLWEPTYGVNLAYAALHPPRAGER